uniref:Uncharacterized protein n=1 Tax=Myoviridae sp. ctCpP1 TaxID=2825054 RepID=A0A8S5V7H1_9CAUD|nr:MAG TPA: hypothetical protein [Myoviridae sp. ctCpP1]
MPKATRMKSVPPFFIPLGVSHLVCGYSNRYQARETPSHQNKKRKPK